MKKNSGFTLIELVVVMAILAILAGVAVPAYSGYIKKANETADQQKIEAVETAMQSALAMNGYDENDAETYFKVSVDTKGTGIDISAVNTNDAVWTTYGDFDGDVNIELKEKTPGNVKICGTKVSEWRKTNSNSSEGE